MKKIGKLLKILLWVLALPLLFILISLTLTYIPAGNQHKDCNRTERIYLNSTLIHTDIVLPLEAIDADLRNGLYLKEGEEYVAFGWGDKKFYLETPTWDDLKTTNVLIALFTFSESMMHIERFEKPGDEWIELMICKDQLNYLNQYIERKFGKNSNGEKVLVKKDGYQKETIRIDTENFSYFKLVEQNVFLVPIART